MSYTLHTHRKSIADVEMTTMGHTLQNIIRLKKQSIFEHLNANILHRSRPV